MLLLEKKKYKNFKKMKKINFLVLTLFFAIGCFSQNAIQNSEKVNINKPNIVFILSDDLSFRDVSAYGQKNYKTPNIDKLCLTSARFTQAYAAAPECAPSRGSFLSGKHVGHGPIRLNSSARGFEFLPENTYTLAKMLQETGYKTGVVGKWGLGYKDDAGNPLKQGFDYHFGFLTHYEAHSYFPLVLYENNKEIHYPENKGMDIKPLYEKDRGNPDRIDFEKYYDQNGKLVYMNLAKAAYAPDLFDTKAAEFIHKNKKDPFFLWFATNLPHGPTIVDDFRQLKDRKDMDIQSREWGAMVQRLDISVGKLVDKLKEEGVYDNTIIIFASDNGYSMHNPTKGKGNKQNNGRPVWEDDPFLQNKGTFTGGKFTGLEGGMRIPFFIHMPKQDTPSVISEPVWLVDLFPTFASVSNSKPINGLDGYNLIPLMNGDRNSIPKDRFMYFTRKDEQAVRQGPWFAYRSHPKQDLELYLIEEDQLINVNLASQYPQISAVMKTIIEREQVPAEWYWNPGDTQDIFNQKVKKAKETGQLIKNYRPNNIKLMPWETE
jgi:arylsulfatase A